MDNDLIYRQAAIEFIDYLLSQPCKEHTVDFVEGMRDGYYRIRSVIKYLPSAQIERKKGKWIKEYWNGEHTRKCSACNITQTVTTYRGKVNFNFCPYCGADMRGGEDE